MNARHRPVWKHMTSGRIVDLAHLTADDIHWPDIVSALSGLARYDAATSNCLYFVAQHACLAHDNASGPPVARLIALLHDAHEAFIGDITTPTNDFLDYLNAASGAISFLDYTNGANGAVSMLIHVAKRRLDRAIFAAAGIRPDDAATYRPMIDALDARLLATEVRDLCAESRKPGAWGKLAEPLKTRIKPWGPDKAAEEFVARLAVHGIDGRGT
ncbi:hypothetical protein [Stappia sp. ES.058]|uniref:hypothetical protein n=1 Tax=Stappia sp. ES.058 TaxID=1881061 RepID=UPI0012FDA59F|nr:hypothetical protein [Stappia sp. ES.058]